MNKTYLGIDIGSIQICAVIAQKDDSENIKILGTGTSKSQGVKKGIITNIDLASSSIKDAVDDAKRMAGEPYDEVIVSISGAYAKSTDSSGIVNIPDLDIGLREINRAMQMADHNANIQNEYEKLHVLPYMFKVDDQEHIEDPLGMNGSRLEVLVHIITVQKSSLSNVKKAVKKAGINIDNIVLSGYASAISTLNSDEKELGVALIDMGGATCNTIIHTGNSIRYNDFLRVGSFNITSDLSMTLHTPIPEAEQVKLKYGALDSANTNELIELPVMGEEGKTHEVNLDIISKVLFARVEETLMILANSIEDSGYKDQIGAGVVLTGGFTKLKGLRELATAIFGNMPVRLAKPRELEGSFDNSKDPTFSTAIGLVLYGGGAFTPYEIDSNKKMRYKGETDDRPTTPHTETSHSDEIESLMLEEVSNKKSAKNELAEIADISKQNGDSALKKFWHWLTQLF